MAADHRFAGRSISRNITEPPAISAHYLGGTHQVVALVAGEPCHWPCTIPVSQTVLYVARMTARKLQIFKIIVNFTLLIVLIAYLNFFEYLVWWHPSLLQCILIVTLEK